LRIVFAGTPDHAAKSLEALVNAGHAVVGVLTRTDAPAGRGGKVAESSVAALANSLGIPVFKANNVDQVALDWLSGLNPELGVIVAYGCILRSEALKVPSKGWVNLHFSLLPKYPGASPVQQALLDGEATTGVTVFKLDEGVDTGPILDAEETDILPHESAGVLMERLTDIGSKLLNKTLGNFEGRLASQVDQERNNDRRITKKISRSMAKLDFSATAQEVANKVRAMNPEPVAWFEIQSGPVRVLQVRELGPSESATGEARLIGSQLVVGCSNGAVELEIVQPAGKKQMSGADWFRGLRSDSLFLS
jgi:methionyl-tRNA formyltransferase